MTVLSLCAGNATRFNGELKQLLPIGGGETILGRQLRQVKNFGVPEEDIFVVTRSAEIVEYTAKLGIQTEYPSSCSKTCDTALSTHKLWGEKTVILLGDVIYSNDVIKIILSVDTPIKFFGDLWEIYAVAFNTHFVARRAFTLGNEKSDYGKLRHAYRGLIGKSYDRKENIKMLKGERLFHYVDSWVTRDCDTPTEYENIKKELVNTGALSFY